MTNELTQSGMDFGSMIEVEAPDNADGLRILSQSGVLLRAMWDKHTARCTIERAGGRWEVAVSVFGRYYATTQDYYVISVPSSGVSLENSNPHHVIYKLRELGLTGVDAECVQMAVSKLVALMDSVEEVTPCN